MRICFVSYEYPPDTGIGGIATYVQQVARQFARRGIDVTVVCASAQREETIPENEYLTIQRIRCNNTASFNKLSPSAVALLHNKKKFDLLEVPEYGAEGLLLKKQLPSLPLIVKLHTPAFLIKALNDYYYDQRLLRRLKTKLGLGYHFENDKEYQSVLQADHILSPSHSLQEIAARTWNIDPNRIIHAPNPYYPSPTLLNIPVSQKANTVLYMGRLETRKGVWNLARAIPQVLQSVPGAQFIFLGRDSRGPYREKSMKAALLKELGTAAANVRFIDHIPLTEVPAFLSGADICVFPSLWENFPNVCLEAMAAARGIVASSEGGMRDMLEDIKGGILINPHDTVSIAQGIIELLKNDTTRIKMAVRSRQKAIDYYGDRMIDHLLKIYRSFVQREIILG